MQVDKCFMILFVQFWVHFLDYTSSCTFREEIRKISQQLGVKDKHSAISLWAPEATWLKIYVTKIAKHRAHRNVIIRVTPRGQQQNPIDTTPPPGFSEIVTRNSKLAPQLAVRKPRRIERQRIDYFSSHAVGCVEVSLFVLRLNIG